MKTAVKEAINSQHEAMQALPSPAQLKQRLPLTPDLAVQIERQRQQLRDALIDNEQRLVVITGPCSLHDEQAALDYGQRLAALHDELGDKLLLVMRAYVEKPRTTVGWKGLAYDPERNGQGNMAKGLERSRSLLVKLAGLGLPLATEALNPLVMHYLDDLVSWVAIGARTSESQIHREMVSRLTMPVGIKNSTDGSVTNAINAMAAAAHSHHTLGVNSDGQMVMLTTPGNRDTHLVLRGGHNLTNYDETSVAQALAELQRQHCHAKVLVDCSHANACKQHDRQIPIALEVLRQRAAGNNGIMGIMLESNIAAGRQDDHGGVLRYGQSITDACIGFEQTADLLRVLHTQL